MPVNHINARAEPNVDESVEFEGDDGLAHSRPRYVKGLRQLALGWKTLSHLIFSVGNALRELLRDLFVEAPGLSHSAQSACTRPAATTRIGQGSFIGPTCPARQSGKGSFLHLA